MSEYSEGVWRPGVKPMGGHPSSTMGFDQVRNKTSLAYDDGNTYNSNIRTINKQILSSSQSYNNTPKPFLRNTPDDSSTSQSYYKKYQENQISGSPYIKVNCNESSTSDVENMNKNTAQQSSQSSPKLVHKQYNSPIDLYSMNNIRKTIEAHTELIAPGLKGINFMKQDSAYNKQSSEVYKLIKEEEERKKLGGCMAKSVSPISGHSVDSSCIKEQQVLHATQERQCQDLKVYRSPQMDRPISIPSTCFECGNKILGVCAKVAGQFIHPDCFKCSTCGTCLKNVGFFTVNEKLYCTVHAEQVAKMMRINYDFKKESSLESSGVRCGGVKGYEGLNRFSDKQQQLTPGDKGKSIGLAGLLSTSSTNLNYEQDKHKLAHTRESNLGGESQQQSTSESQSSYASQFKQTGCLSSYLNQNVVQSDQNSVEQMSHQSSSNKTSVAHCYDKKPERVPVCTHCCAQIYGPYILAGKRTWCKQCSQTHFTCNSCRRSLLDVGFIEDVSNKQYCERCFEAYYAPVCSKCNLRVKGDCLNALGKHWHPSCFVCGHCKRPFGNSSFYLEDNIPYCERDWNQLFTTKCFSCSYPIETGDKWIEALNRSYHSRCFRCTSCQVSLEGSTFYCKGGKPYCRLHVSA